LIPSKNEIVLPGKNLPAYPKEILLKYKRIVNGDFKSHLQMLWLILGPYAMRQALSTMRAPIFEMA